MRPNRAITLIALLCLSVSALRGQVVRFLNKEWLVYDKATHLMYSYPHQKKLPLHLLVNFSENKGLYLAIPSSEKLSVYINNAFYREVSEQTMLVISVDSLASLSKDSSMIVSVFGQFNKKLFDSTCFMPRSSMKGATQHTSNLANVWALPAFNGKNHFALVMLICLVLFVLVYRAYPKTFGQYFNFADLFLNYKVDTLYMRSTFEGHYIASLILSCVFFAFTGIGLPLFSKQSQGQEFVTFWGDLLYLLLLAVFFYFLKFAVTQVSAWFFSLQKHATMHYKVFVRIAVVWSIVLGMLSVLCHSSLADIFPALPLITFCSLFFLTLISIKVSVLINRATRVSTLYLISYLCITEWLPYFVILKLYEKYFS
jgi:hypothetical protein